MRSRRSIGIISLAALLVFPPAWIVGVRAQWFTDDNFLYWFSAWLIVVALSVIAGRKVSKWFYLLTVFEIVTVVSLTMWMVAVP